MYASSASRTSFFRSLRFHSHPLLSLSPPKWGVSESKSGVTLMRAIWELRESESLSAFIGECVALALASVPRFHIPKVL